MKNKQIALLLLLLSFSVAKAQEGEIIYKQFDPPLFIDCDHSGNGNYATYVFDLNEDGDKDLKLYCDFGKGDIYIAVQGYGYTRFRSVVDTIPCDTYEYVWANWSKDVPDSTGNYYERIGIRKTIDGEHYYGWLHQYGHADDSFPFRKCLSVDKVAFCTVPNYPLLWGQISFTKIEENEHANAFATLHPNPTKGLVTIAGENLRQAEVFNMLGQKLLSMQGEGNELQINMTALPAGVYFISVSDEEGQKCVRKVVKE